MKANVGGIDKWLRILLGLALIAWAATGGPAWAWIGVVPLATGGVQLLSAVPAYRHQHLPALNSARKTGTKVDPAPGLPAR